MLSIILRNDYTLEETWTSFQGGTFRDEMSISESAENLFSTLIFAERMIMTQSVTMDQEFLSDQYPPLFIRQITPQSWHAQLIFLHASTVHSEYYLPLALKWAQEGIRVILPDLRGHGRSSGPRGHVQNFRQYLKDIQRIYTLMQDQYPDPTFVGGESYGALLAYLICTQNQANLKGGILIAPSFGLYFNPPSWVQYLMTQALHPIWPRLRPILPLPVEGVARNPNITHLIERDRNANRHYTLGFLVSLWQAQEQVQKEPLPAVPLLTLLSAEDGITRNDCTEQVLKNHPDKIVRYHYASGHSLVADQPEFVLKESMEWMRKHIKALSSDAPVMTS